jgi:ribosomal protein S18 acetylase RimI-like enzyme
VPRIRAVDRDDLLELGPALADVYLSAFSSPPHRETEADAAGWLVRLPTHAARPGFRLVAAAADGDTLVGFAYGYTGGPGQWWTDAVGAQLTREERERWLVGHFEVVDVAVRQESQGGGIGRGLLDALLDGRPEPTAALSTQAWNAPAIALYRSAGWSVLRDDVRFPDSDEDWLMMVREL